MSPELAEAQERVMRWRERHPVLRGLAIAALSLLLLLSAAIGMLDTAPGHRLIIDRISALRPSSGLRIHIGRIDGSIWNRATIRDLRLYDARGLFLEAPELELDWRPAAWIANKLWIRRLESALLILHRMPKMAPTTKKGPLLPGFDIHIGKLAIKTLRLEAPVAGRRQLVRLAGGADVRAGRMLLRLNAASAAQDRLVIRLDSEPDRNRFDVDAKIVGPATGAIAGITGWKRAVDGLVSGDGSWAKWKGRATLDVGDVRLVELGLTARRGRYALAGSLAPTTFLKGKLQRLTAPAVAVDGAATLADRQLDGSLSIRTAALDIAMSGRLDLAANAFAGVAIDARLLKPSALFPNMTGRNIRLHANFAGPFASAAFAYKASADHLAFDATGFDVVRAEGKGRLSTAPIKVPIRFTARRVTGIGDVAGGILGNLRLDGVLQVTSALLTGKDMKLSSDKLAGGLSLRVDLRTGQYDVALSGKLLRYFIPGIGIVDVNSELNVVPGPAGRGTAVAGRGRAWVRRFDNGFLRSLAGGLPYIDTSLRRGSDGVLHFDRLSLRAPDIRISGSGYRRRDGSFYFKGSGTQARYGKFQMLLDGNISRPKIDLLLAAPMPTLGLAEVTVKLNPTPQGFDYAAGGTSTLGGWTSNGAILLPSGQAATIAVAGLEVSGAKGGGSLRSDPQGFTGRIDLAGGAITGPLVFSIEGGVQKIEAHLRVRRANLDGAFPVSLAGGRLDGTVLLDPAGVRINGTVGVIGATMRGASLGRGQAEIDIRGETGSVVANFSGARGRGFRLSTVLRLAPDTVTLSAEGIVDRKPIRLDMPAVVHREGDGWRLDPTTLFFAGGRARLAGHFAPDVNEVKASVEAMPLSVLDLLYPQLGLSGVATGDLDYRLQRGARIPTGRANLRIRGMSRSGLVLTSRPADVAVAAVLTENVAAARAVVSSEGKTIGRAQMRISVLPASGMLADRLRAGNLFAQIRYAGPADMLWRLVGVETIDLSGPVAIGADISGTAADPRIHGSFRSTQARLESAVSGTVISNIAASGRFDGSRLLIGNFKGQTRSGGSVTGRANFDFAGGKGFGMDVALTADQAQLINRDDIGATVSGPLTIRSDGGSSGRIAGDLRLDRGRFTLGRAAAVAAIPQFQTIELNRPEEGGVRPRRTTWALDIALDARNQLMVTGLGLDSEWRGKMTLGGTIDNPTILGRVDLLRGGYEFAGRRFDLDRGAIRFLGESPPDPLLDITARANVNGVNATIGVTGTGQHPEINFSSIPALPEDELLSRLLFGTSITNLSAPEALQLAAAVGSLRGGGGGLNPINAVRRAAGLDRLRILPADPSVGIGTAIAAGKYLGRKTYIEVISDGQGYSATRIEYQITRWLSLLGSISTIGRQSAGVKLSKDY